MVLKRYRPRIIAITGNVGKTSAKDAIYATLSPHLKVRKSQKSFNSEIGVPLTILGRDNAWKNPFLWLVNIVMGLKLFIIPEVYPRWLILEVGADRPGDIRAVARWLKPDVVILTGVSDIPVHVEYFDSPSALLAEKKTLVEYLKPGGTLIVNGDDVRMRDVLETWSGEKLSYGFESNNSLVASNDSIVYEGAIPTGISFDVREGDDRVTVQVHGAIGKPRAYAALAALASAKILSISLKDAALALRSWAPPPGRMRIIEGMRSTIIIDDSYNSSPAAALSALDAMREINANGRRKIAILGDMLELGRYSADAHRTVGERAASVVDMLITVGFRARATAQAALDNGMSDGVIRQYELNESERAGKELEPELQEWDIVLIKGSESMRMERAVLELMAHPEQASELLVRQNVEWIAKK